MPAASPPVGPQASTLLATLGARLRARRKALGVSATTAAEAAGISRVTLHRIEAGAPSVTIGAVAAAAHAVGLSILAVDVTDDDGTVTAAALPAVIAVADHPQLKQLAWQLGDAATLTPREAFALYERNWRHVDVDAMDDEERTLVRRLALAMGSKPLV